MKDNEETLDKISLELVSIRRLMLFALMRGGASQSELAETLGVSQSSISRMIPSQKKESKKAK